MENNTDSRDIKYTDQDYQNFRMYHELQYERIDKLEGRRENFSSIVLSISLAIIAFGFPKETIKSPWLLFGLSIIVIVANLCAYIFAQTTLDFVKMHQNRAKLARTKFSPNLNEINDKVGKKESRKDLFNRTNLYKMLHSLIILVTFIVLISASSDNYILQLIYSLSVLFTMITIFLDFWHRYYPNEGKAIKTNTESI